MTRRLAISGLATVLAALALSASSPATAQMAKEGTLSGTYTSYGMAKMTPVGKDRLLLTFDENGLTVGQGLTDHMTWHCWGMGDFTNGVGQNHGFCVATDTAGDQLAGNFVDDEKHAPDQKSWRGSYTFTTGTGKFAGVSGGFTFVVHGNEFRTPTEGTYVQYGTYQGSYKLPTPTN